MRFGDEHIVCGAGPYDLVVCVTRDRNRRVGLSGQVTTAGSIHAPAAGLPLQVVGTGHEGPIVAADTDAFGEFHLECDLYRDLALRVGTGAGASLVPLDEEAL